MSLSNQSVQPYYMEFLRCARCSQHFEYKNRLYHPITLPICGHTMCGQCINIICNETKCPQDQISFGINHTPIDQLLTNYPLLLILYDRSKLPQNEKEHYGQCPSYMKLDQNTKHWFNRIESFFGDISLEIKPIINDKECQSIFSRSMMQKIFNLLNSQYIDREGRLKVLKAARSLGEHIYNDFILHHQNPQQLTDNLQKHLESLRKFDFTNNDEKNIADDNQNHDQTWLKVTWALQSVQKMLEFSIDLNRKKKEKTNLSEKNLGNHDPSHNLSSTGSTSSTSSLSSMIVSSLGGSSTTSEYYLQSLDRPTSQHNQDKYKTRFFFKFIY